jgi:hypothetical protein
LKNTIKANIAVLYDPRMVALQINWTGTNQILSNADYPTTYLYSIHLMPFTASHATAVFN